MAGRKAQPDTNTEKGKRFQGGWIEENVGDESMGSSRIHLRGTWQDTSLLLEVLGMCRMQSSSK